MADLDTLEIRREKATLKVAILTHNHPRFAVCGVVSKKGYTSCVEEI